MTQACLQDNVRLFTFRSKKSIGGGGSNCCYNTQYSNGSSCASCNAGADCSIVGTNIATQVLETGYWRANINTTDIRKCRLPAACNNTATITAIANNALLLVVVAAAVQL
jgi:hypothetical protein